MKKRYFTLMMGLVLLGAIIFSLVTFKVTYVSTDLALNAFYKIQYNESSVKTDVMTEIYESDLKYHEELKSSDDFIVRTIASMGWFMRTVATLMFLALEVAIIKLLRDIMFMLIKRKHKSRRKPA